MFCVVDITISLEKCYSDRPWPNNVHRWSLHDWSRTDWPVTVKWRSSQGQDSHWDHTVNIAVIWSPPLPTQGVRVCVEGGIITHLTSWGGVITPVTTSRFGLYSDINVWQRCLDIRSTSEITQKKRISNPVWRAVSSHSSHHPRFSWPSLAFMCTKVT